MSSYWWFKIGCLENGVYKLFKPWSGGVCSSHCKGKWGGGGFQDASQDERD